VAGSPTSFRVEVLTENDWHRLRDIRLSALVEASSAFLANHATEAAFSEQRWRQEFGRGEWNLVCAGGRDVALVGVTREAGMPSQECYLEYLWVAPGFRRIGVASMLLRTVLDRLRDSGVRTCWLWILNGNDRAMRLYQRFGFQSTNVRQPLPGSPKRSEEKLRLRLRLP
jgi:ribosomal protein S18 acetylase RimI-like enzyme